MDLLAIARIDWTRLTLITVTGIRALIVDLHHHTRSHGAPIRGVEITLGCDMPALATPFSDARNYAGGFTTGFFLAKIGAAGVGEIVGGGEANAMVTCC